MSIIDFHNHFYPPEYLAALEPSGSVLCITHDGQGNPVVHYPGDYNVMVPGHRDIAYRQSVLDAHGIRTQVITLTTPGTHVEAPPVAAKLATITNDAFAGIRALRGARFVPLATLPLCDPAASVLELTRALDELRLPGAMLFSNVNGVGLDDERFWPVYEVADDRGAVLMIHPTYPVGVEAMQEYWLMPLTGFLFDTTLAASKLVFSGTVRRFPKIRWVLGHLGGTIPYLAERLDRGFRAFKECRAHIDELVRITDDEMIAAMHADLGAVGVVKPTLELIPKEIRKTLSCTDAFNQRQGCTYPLGRQIHRHSLTIRGTRIGNKAVAQYGSSHGMIQRRSMDIALIHAVPHKRWLILIAKVCDQICVGQTNWRHNLLLWIEIFQPGV